MVELVKPRFMIAATNSGCGKTTIVCGLLKALMNRGLKVSAFKSGPDYIDPMFHSRVIGAKSRNLDLFLVPRETAKYLVAKNSQDADVAVFEAAMGYYDGMGKTTEASAYDLASTCKVPVILVVNGKGAALSIAAQIKGFKEFRPDSNVVGAILNRMNPMSYLFYKDVIEQETGVKLLGYMPILDDSCNFESRHLGLVTAQEIADLQVIVDKLAAQCAKSIDIDAVLELAQQAEGLDYAPQPQVKLGNIKLAVAMDKAFCFYYQDALDLFTELGAELVPFSPLEAKKLPECDGVYFGGGYPELYPAELEANVSLRQDIKSKLAAGLPCFAECGGFMYLMEEYEAKDGKRYAWVGACNGSAHMTNKLTRFGYVHLTCQEDCIFGKAGSRINAHEFHYSDSTNNGAGFMAVKASGKGSWPCAQTSTTLYAGYPHMHLWGNPDFARNFVNKCLEHKNK